MDLHDFYRGKYVAKMCKLIGKDSVCHTCIPVYTGCLKVDIERGI